MFQVGFPEVYLTFQWSKVQRFKGLLFGLVNKCFFSNGPTHPCGEKLETSDGVSFAH